MWGHRNAILFIIASYYWSTGSGRQCGFPGRPRNGSSSTASQVSRPGDTAHYTCLPRFTLFGEQERVCLDSGIWAGQQPLCELNLSLERTALMSATLWNYRASLAVDGNPDTCSFTPRSSEQRWWQADLSDDQIVGSVALIINKDSYQELTIFVIQLLSKSEALYKPCASFKGRFQNPRILFICNKGLGHRGRYIYVRDDRKDQDYFGLCEVEVFAYREEISCGDPEQPVAGRVALGVEGTAVYSCESGYRLTAEPNRTCDRDGHWAGHAPQCQEIQCESPAKTPFGFPEIYHLKGKFPFDTRVTYKCQAGYVIWGNATRACTETGVWSGTVPQCKPITCGYPKTYPQSDVELLNQSTLWNAVAVYSCKMGYSFAPGTTQVTIKCLGTGIWEKINVSCIVDRKRNLPVKLTGSEYGQKHSDADENGNREETIGTPGIVIIGIFCSLLIITLAVVGIFFAKRFQSQKAAHQAAVISKSSTNDLIINNAKEGIGIYDDVTPAVSIVVQGQPQCPPPVASAGATLDKSNNLHLHAHSFFSRQEPNQYDTLCSLPSMSMTSCNYNALEMNNLTLPAKTHHPLYGTCNASEQHQETGYETVRRHPEYEYETICNLQHLGMDTTYEIIQQPKQMAEEETKIAENPQVCAVPLAMSYFLQSQSPQLDMQMQSYNEAVSPEILALYAQVDKTKKRYYKPENEPEMSHSSSVKDECSCKQHPISDIGRFTQPSCTPSLWNGHARECDSTESVDNTNTFRPFCASGASDSLKRPLPLPPVIPSVRYLPQQSELLPNHVDTNQL